MAYFVDTEFMPGTPWPAPYNPQIAYFGYPGLMAPLPVETISMKFAGAEPTIKTAIDGTKWAYAPARTGAPRREWSISLTAPESVAQALQDQFNGLWGAGSSTKLGGWQFLPPLAGRNMLTYDESVLTHIDTYDGDYRMGSQSGRQVFQAFDSAAYRTQTRKTTDDYVTIGTKIPVFPGAVVKVVGWWSKNPKIQFNTYNQYGNAGQTFIPQVKPLDNPEWLDWRESAAIDIPVQNVASIDVVFSLREDFHLLEPRVIMAPATDEYIFRPTDPTLRQAQVRGSRALSVIVTDINVTPVWYPTAISTHSVGEPLYEVTAKITELG